MNRESSGSFFKNIIQRMHLSHRIAISIAAALLAYLFTFQTKLDGLVIAMISWNAFSFSFILTSCLVFFNRGPAQMRARAIEEDGSRIFVFMIILVSGFASLVAVLKIILTKDTSSTPRIIYVPVAVITMLLS